MDGPLHSQLPHTSAKYYNVCMCTYSKFGLTKTSHHASHRTLKSANPIIALRSGTHHKLEATRDGGGGPMLPGTSQMGTLDVE